jgi:TRAP-type C4-dicarboxylate transport system permease small subunit
VVRGKNWVSSPSHFTLLVPIHFFHEIFLKELFMGQFLDKVLKLTRLINFIGGSTLAFIMFLTVADIILRSFRRPIIGTFEIVAFSGAIVIGFSVPYTTWMRGHVYTDFLVVKFSKKMRNLINIATRCLGIGLFFTIGWNLIRFGMDLHKSGEVSPTLTMPFYPVAYAIGICCFVQCLVLLCDILKIFGGKYE